MTENAKTATGPQETDEAKIKRTRSPNYPSYKIDTALAKANALYAAFKKFPVPLKSAAEKMGFSSANSSTAAQAIATLKAYGFVDVAGSGDKRTVAVTDIPIKILAKHPDAPELLKKAALAPKIHRELYDKFVTADGIAPDDSIRNYLRFDRPDGPFNELAIDPLIREFRATLTFAGLDSSDIMSETLTDTPIAEGDLVQWESQGALQFPEPRRVTGFSDDGQWLFVEGSPAGLPVAECRRENPRAPTAKKEVSMSATQAAAQVVPPPNPTFKPAIPAASPPATTTAGNPPAAGQKDFPLYLSNNQKAILWVPASMSKKDYDLLKKQLDSHLMIIEATSVADETAN